MLRRLLLSILAALDCWDGFRPAIAQAGDVGDTWLDGAPKIAKPKLCVETIRRIKGCSGPVALKAGVAAAVFSIAPKKRAELSRYAISFDGKVTTAGSGDARIIRDNGDVLRCFFLSSYAGYLEVFQPLEDKIEIPPGGRLTFEIVSPVDVNCTVEATWEER